MKKILDKLAQKLNLQILFFIFLTPFIDTYEELIGDKVQILGIALIELFKIGLVGYLFFLCIYHNRQKVYKILKKYKIWWIILGIIYLIFIIFHLYNVAIMDNSLIAGLSNNYLIEFYYLFRTYGLCLLLLIILFLNDIDKETFIKDLSMLGFLISITIVLSNIFKIGYIAYDSSLLKSEPIKGSIFNWFTDLTLENADLYSTKAWFFVTNQLSLVLITTLMISTLYLITSNKKILYVTYPFKLLASLMLSTKACTYGIFIALGMLIVVTPGYKLFKREKINYILLLYSFILLFLFRLLFQYSPINYKINIFKSNNSNNNYVAADIIIDSDDLKELDEVDEDDNKLVGISLFDLAKKENMTKKEEQLFINQFSRNYRNLGIYKLYVDLYPVEDNLAFWKKTVLLPQSSRTNYRNFKILMYEDVLNKDNHKFYDLTFGLGYVSHFEYIEKDFIGQVALVGILGTILLIGPFIIIYLYLIYQILRNLKKQFNLINIFLGATVGEFFLATYIAGHGFGNIFPMTFFIVCLRCLALNVMGVKNEKK